MEQPSSLFALSVDPAAKAHLADAAKWARFLAIVGFVFLVVLVAAGVMASVAVSRYESVYSEQLGVRSRGIGSLFGGGIAFTYFIGALIWFFPLFYLLRFSNAARSALNSDDQARLTTSFQNLKVCFRYLGIVTIIVLVLFALGVVIGIAGSAIN